MNFITAQSARAIVTGALTFEGLAEASSKAIVEAASNGSSHVDIPYDGVSANTHLQFHTFITSRGFEGTKTNPAKLNGKFVYRIRW